MFYKDLIDDAIVSCRFHTQYGRVIKSIYIRFITNETLRELESLQKGIAWAWNKLVNIPSSTCLFHKFPKIFTC